MLLLGELPVPISVVTGGHTGLGLAIARELVEGGSHVLITSRSAQAATGTAAALRQLLDCDTVSAYPHALDVRRSQSVEAFFLFVEKHHGGQIDV